MACRDLVREALGDHIYDKAIENKKIGGDNYQEHTSQYGESCPTRVGPR